MSLEDFDTYMKSAVDNYAKEKQKGEGLTPEAAIKVAKESYAQLLPQGLETQNQFLFSVIDQESKSKIGILWIAKRMNGEIPHAFICDIELVSEKRGQGLGKLLLTLMENEVRKMGCHSIGLHVFGHNATAIALYEKFGFYTTNRMMKKDLN